VIFSVLGCGSGKEYEKAGSYAVKEIPCHAFQTLATANGRSGPRI
jgi:hypothetical protein